MKKDKNTKQQRVRVLQTGDLGTVTDQVLMKRGNKPMVYKQVRLDSHPQLDCWYWADQLGDTRETCRITLAGGDGTELYIKVTYDYEGYGGSSFEVSGKPADMREHDRRGLPFLLMYALMKGLDIHGADVSVVANSGPVKPAKN